MCELTVSTADSARSATDRATSPSLLASLASRRLVSMPGAGANISPATTPAAAPTNMPIMKYASLLERIYAPPDSGPASPSVSKRMILSRSLSSWKSISILPFFAV